MFRGRSERERERKIETDRQRDGRGLRSHGLEFGVWHPGGIRIESHPKPQHLNFLVGS